MKIVFFGSSKSVIPILEVLRKNFDLVLIVTTEKLASKGDVLRGCPVIAYCTRSKIPYLPVQQFSNVTMQQLRGANAPLGVLAYFGLILPKEVLELFPKGILNIHPSLLPKYRGPTPGQTAILNNDKKTGVSIIMLDEEVDHGPLLTQVEEPILPTDTADSLYERLFRKGAELLHQNINKYIKSAIKLSPQDHAKATFTKHLTRQSGFVDLNNPLPAGRQVPSPEKLNRMIRAYHPWPGVWTHQIINNRSSIIKFLPQQKIQVEGGKPMTYKDFINGYPEARQWLDRMFLEE